MCECGCISNESHYTLPAPKGALYVISVNGPCTNCDAPAGVIVELIDRAAHDFREYKKGGFLHDGELPLKDWYEGCKGAAIVTGFLKHEFVEALSKHLIGLDLKSFTDNGKIDKAGAEVLLEEMYEDSQVRPYFALAKT